MKCFLSLLHAQVGIFPFAFHECNGNVLQHHTFPELCPSCLPGTASSIFLSVSDTPVSPHIHFLPHFPFLLLRGVKGLVFSLLPLLCSGTELSFIGLQCDYKASLRREMLWSSRDACAKSMVRSLLCPWEMVEPCGQLHSQITNVGHTLEWDPETSTFLFL